MSSWSENASPLALRALDELLGVAVGHAQQELVDHGEFIPYGAAIGLGGQPELVFARPAYGGDEPLDVIDACMAALHEKQHLIQAAAIVADISTPEGDAIKVDLEHAEGHAITVLFPYRKTEGSRRRRLFGGPAGHEIEYGEMQELDGEPQLWTGR
jgi:hypothetical protein